LSELAASFALPTIAVVVEAGRVNRYLRAIGGSESLGVSLPPRSLASWYLLEPLRRFLAGGDPAAQLGVPGRRLVLGELAVTFEHPPAVGDRLTVTGALAGRRVRGEKEFFEFVSRADSNTGRPAAQATMTIVAI
jgi:hypothetical protein